MGQKRIICNSKGHILGLANVMSDAQDNWKNVKGSDATNNYVGQDLRNNVIQEM